jgi:hypothetical protein
MCYAGIAVVTYDLRGHGNSGFVDGIPMYTHSMEDHVQDFLAVLKFAMDRHVGMPCFVYGESFGGALAAACTSRMHVPRSRQLPYRVLVRLFQVIPFCQSYLSLCISAYHRTQCGAHESKTAVRP